MRYHVLFIVAPEIRTIYGRQKCLPRHIVSTPPEVKQVQIFIFTSQVHHAHISMRLDERNATLSELLSRLSVFNCYLQKETLCENQRF